MATGDYVSALYHGGSGMRIQEFDYSVNLLQSILWQYGEATNLLSIINQKQAWYENYQTEFWQDWYTDVFNLLTANAFGIAVWSYILNVPLYTITEPEPADAPIWGFNQIVGSWPTLLNTYLNFGNSNFSTKGQILILTLEEQRFLLRLRYFQLYTAGAISNATLPTGTYPPLTGINDFLNYLVSTSDIGYSGTIYVLDGLNMTMTYVFTASDFPSELFNVIRRLHIFPRPAGVGLKYHVNYGKQFGFNAIVGSWPTLENNNQNFGNGNFIAPLTF